MFTLLQLSVVYINIIQSSIETFAALSFALHFTSATAVVVVERILLHEHFLAFGRHHLAVPADMC